MTLGKPLHTHLSFPGDRAYEVNALGLDDGLVKSINTDKGKPLHICFGLPGDRAQVNTIGSEDGLEKGVHQ